MGSIFGGGGDPAPPPTYQTPPQAGTPVDPQILAAATWRGQAGMPYLSSPWRTMDFLHGLGGQGIGAMQTPQFNPGNGQSQFNPGYGGGYTNGWDPGVYASGQQTPTGQTIFNMLMGGANSGAPPAGVGGGGAGGGGVGSSGGGGGGAVQPKGAQQGVGDAPRPSTQPLHGQLPQQQQAQGPQQRMYHDAGNGRNYSYAPGSSLDQALNSWSPSKFHQTDPAVLQGLRDESVRSLLQSQHQQQMLPIPQGPGVPHPAVPSAGGNPFAPQYGRVF